MAVKNRKKFAKEAKSGLKRNVRARRIVLALSILVFTAALFVSDYPARLLLSVTALLAVFSVYLSVFSKAVERAGMLRLVKPSKLTEGDWIAREIVVRGKRVTGPKDLGVSKRQIAQLKRLYSRGEVKRVMVKVGIPFVPSFLVAFVITLAYGNVFIMLLRII